ncbi:serine/threonine-protein kinase [Streptomyces sp. NPDC002577]
MQELRPDDPRQVGPYTVTGRLGSGGMGEVFLGRSRSGRAVAIKIVRAAIAADPGFRSRFRQEVDAARRVGGFWTAPVVDADPDAAMPWVASQYVPAPDLGALVTGSGALAEHEVQELGTGLAEALQSIHRAGLVHRDLKPSNVLVTDDGPRVIDFGISKALEGTTTGLTGTGMVIGTPRFMSPEQASGAPVGTASDVFSLGSVLVFAATGRGPFGEGTVPALLYRVVHDEPDLTAVPERLRQVLSMCLDKHPELRPSASQLLDVLAGGNAGHDGAAQPSGASWAADGSRTGPVPPPGPTGRVTVADPEPAVVEPEAEGPQPGPGGGEDARAHEEGRRNESRAFASSATDDGYRLETRSANATKVSGGFTLFMALLFLGPMTVLALLVGFRLPVTAAITVTAVLCTLLSIGADAAFRRTRKVSVRAERDGLHLTSGRTTWHKSWSDLISVTLAVTSRKSLTSLGLKVTVLGGAAQNTPKAFAVPKTDGRRLLLHLNLPEGRVTAVQLAALHSAMLRHGGGVYEPDAAFVAELSSVTNG